MDVFSLMATIGLDSSAFVKGLQSAGNLMMKFAGGVVDFGVDAVQTGMAFDKQMGSVQAVLGKTEGTMDNMTRLRQFALEQAHDSVFTAEQTGQAYYYMGMAGWKTEQMIAGLPGIMALAAASGEDLGRTSDIVTDSITALGLTADDVSGYVDILAATATNSNTDVSQMGTAFKYAAAVAGGLGVGADDLALSLGLMANAGVKSSQAGTTLRQIFSRLANDTNGARLNMESLGTTIFDNDGKMRDWSDIIEESREGWHDLSQEEQVALATVVAGQRGMTGFMAIMNATDEDFQHLKTSIDESSGAAQEMSEVRLDNLSGDVVKFNSALDVLKVAIYDDVNGPMREIVQWGTGALDRIREAIGKGGLVAGIEQLGTEIEGAAEKFAPMLESLGKAAAPVIGALISTLAESSGPIIELGKTLGQGLLEGMLSGLYNSGNPMLANLATMFGLPLGSSTFSAPSGTEHGGGGGGGIEAPKQVPVEVLADLTIGDAQTIQQQINDSLMTGQDTVTLPLGGENIQVDPSVAQQLATDLQTGLQFSDPGTTIGQELSGNMEQALSSGLDLTAWAAQLSDAGSTAGANLDSGITSATASTGTTVASTISTGLGSVDASPMAAEIQSAGQSGGALAASAVQAAISSASYAINVVAKVTGLPTGGVQQNARAMNVGRIFRSPTIFGAADGALQMAGDAGPEAVIGTNSLSRLIASAVGSGMRAYAASAPQRSAAQPVVLQLNGKTVARVMAADTASATADRNKSIAVGYGG